MLRPDFPTHIQNGQPIAVSINISISEPDGHIRINIICIYIYMYTHLEICQNGYPYVIFVIFHQAAQPIQATSCTESLPCSSRGGRPGKRMAEIMVRVIQPEIVQVFKCIKQLASVRLKKINKNICTVPYI